MSDTTPQTNGTLLTSERLTEIKSLLRYETSISFHSARAKQSMLLLVAEVERQAAERDEALRYAARLEAELCICLPVSQGDGYLHAADCPVASVQQGAVR